MISVSVELCETKVCFWHIQPIGTNVWLPKTHQACTPCIHDHHFKKEGLRYARELSQLRSQIVLKCRYLTRIGKLWYSMVNEQICKIDHEICKDNTSKNPFSRCAACNNYGYGLSCRWQDKVGLQQQEENLASANAWWNRTMRHPTPMTTWKPRPTRITWNATLYKWTCTWFPCSCCHHTHSLHTTSRGSGCLHSSHPCMNRASLFDIELSIPSNFLLFFHFQSPAVLAVVLQFPRG